MVAHIQLTFDPSCYCLCTFKISPAYVPPPPPTSRAKVALSGSSRDYRDPEGPDLIGRTRDFHAWQSTRQAEGYWPYSRALHAAPAGFAKIQDCRGVETSGVNFASQDYLSLATSDELKQAAHEAIERFGVHSAGSAAVLGNTDLSLRLEEALASWLGYDQVALYPTGWAAGYGVSKGLVRKDDYIVLDVLSHNCLFEGANAATSNVSTYRHLDHQHARSIIERIRKKDPHHGILLVTEGLFSMDSDCPDIDQFQKICHDLNATLVVDVAHDLGATGPNGTGQLGLQKMLGKVDLVMGSFSKTFGTNGGFIACQHPSVKQFLKVFSPSHTFSNALSPAQAATALKAIEIITSDQGEQRRLRLQQNIEHLRQRLVHNGHRVLGQASPIVPVLMGEEHVARRVANLLPQYGVLANLVEFPAVPQNQARLRLQVMSHHTQGEIEKAVEGITQALHTVQTSAPA